MSRFGRHTRSNRPRVPVSWLLLALAAIALIFVGKALLESEAAGEFFKTLFMTDDSASHRNR